MEPFLVLVLLPLVIGAAAELAFRDARNASLAAALGATLLLLLVAMRSPGPDAAWSWLAVLLVLPLPIALAVAAALILAGHRQARRGGKRRGA
jgi:hypothetical protein